MWDGRRKLKKRKTSPSIKYLNSNINALSMVQSHIEPPLWYGSVEIVQLCQVNFMCQAATWKNVQSVESKQLDVAVL